jgi:hypothetical protein
MKVYSLALTAGAVLLLAAGVAQADSQGRIGTSSAPELRLPVGARSIALGSSDLVMVGGAEALFYNPAGIANTDRKTDVLFSHTQYIADMKVNYVAVAQDMGGIGRLGVSAKVLSIGTIPYTTEAAPDGTGQTFSPTFSTLGLTYGKELTDRVNFGATVYYISERILQETAAGVAFDFDSSTTRACGARFWLPEQHPRLHTHLAGSAFDQILLNPTDNPQAAGRNERPQSAAFELPSSFQMALGMPVVKGANPVNVFGTFSSNSFGRDDGHLGAEWVLRKVLALRGGYTFNGDTDALFQASYGFGVRLPVGASQLAIDWAAQPVKGGFFDDVQHLSLDIKF